MAVDPRSTGPLEPEARPLIAFTNSHGRVRVLLPERRTFEQVAYRIPLEGSGLSASLVLPRLSAGGVPEPLELNVASRPAREEGGAAQGAGACGAEAHEEPSRLSEAPGNTDAPRLAEPSAWRVHTQATEPLRARHPERRPQWPSHLSQALADGSVNLIEYGRLVARLGSTGAAETAFAEGRLVALTAIYNSSVTPSISGGRNHARMAASMLAARWPLRRPHELTSDEIEVWVRELSRETRRRRRKGVTQFAEWLRQCGFRTWADN